MTGDGMDAKVGGMYAIAARADAHAPAVSPRPSLPLRMRTREAEAPPAAIPGAPLVGCWSYDFASHGFAWVDDVFGSAGVDPLERPTLDGLLRERVHPEDLQNALEAFFTAVQGGCPHQVQYRMRFPDGSQRRILERGRILRDGQGRPRMLIATCHDISAAGENNGAATPPAAERMRAQEQGSLQGVLVHRGGIALHVSAPLVRMLGHESANALLCAEPLRDLFALEDARGGHDCEGDLLRGLREECRHEVRARTAEGETFWGEALRTVVDWDGLRAVQTTVVDITERKRLAAQLQQARQAQAVGSLAGGMAHEFNNVLQIIMGQASILRQALGSGAAPADGLARIQDASRRGSRLVRKLLSVGRKDGLELAPVDVNALVPAVFELVRPSGSSRVQCEFQGGERVPPVRGDAEAIEQILINLYMNARDAMPEGGRLRVTTGDARFFETSLRAHPWAVPGRYVEIAVADTGEGIPGDRLKRIFEPFYSTKSGSRGSGLGLAVVQGLVHEQGGFIRVESEPGQGTVFRIYLPVAETTGQHKALHEEAIKPVVLLVEDDPLVAQLIERVLDEVDCELITVPDGPQALEAFAEQNHRVALVLLDIVLPGTRGCEVYRALRLRDADVPVVFLTGTVPDDGTVAFIQSEGQRLLQQPFGLGELLQAVEQSVPRRAVV